MNAVGVSTPARPWVPRLRVLWWGSSLALMIVSLSPPMWGWSFRYGFAQSIQFCIFAFGAPSLLVVGAPWLGRNGNAAVTESQAPWLLRWNARRVREKAQLRMILAASSVVASSLIWRTAPLVNVLVRDHWLVIIEAVTLFIPMVLMMVEIVESPPFSPGISRPYRIGVAAVVMWSAWVVAYLAGMSQNSWYSAFHHTAARGISATADQQLSAGFVWLLTAAVFVPIIFWNLIPWHQTQEDP